LQNIGIKDIKTKQIQKLDATSDSSIKQLEQIGNMLANQVDLTDFGSFAGT
jgi:hypothetical protein